MTGFSINMFIEITPLIAHSQRWIPRVDLGLKMEVLLMPFVWILDSKFHKKI